MHGPPPLVLKPHKSLPAKELQFVAGSRHEASPLEVFRSVKPAGHVASNRDALADSCPRGGRRDTDMPPSCLSRFRNRLCRKSFRLPPLSKNRSSLRSVPKNRRPTDQAVVPEPSTSSQAAVPPAVNVQDAAAADPRRPTKCGSLRDVSGTESGPSLTPESPAPAEFEVRRLPPPDATVVQPQPSERASEGSDAVPQTQPSTVIPEPSVAVEPSPAVAEPVSNPMRLVVPEPQQPAETNLPRSQSASEHDYDGRNCQAGGYREARGQDPTPPRRRPPKLPRLNRR